MLAHGSGGASAITILLLIGAVTIPVLFWWLMMRLRGAEIDKTKAEAERDTARASDSELDDMGHESGAFTPGINASPLRPPTKPGDGDPGASE